MTISVDDPVLKSGLYLSEDSIRVWTVLKFLIVFGDCIRVGTLFESGFYWRLYGMYVSKLSYSVFTLDFFGD